MNTGIRAHNLLRSSQIDLSTGGGLRASPDPTSWTQQRLRPRLGYRHWDSESGAVTDRCWHLLAQKGCPCPPACSKLSLLRSFLLWSPQVVLAFRHKAQCSVRGGIPVQEKAGRQGGQTGCAGTPDEAPGHIKSLWKHHYRHAHLSAWLR